MGQNSRVSSRYVTGDLIFYEKGDYGSGAYLMTFAPDTITVGSTTQDVDFKVYLGASEYVLFDAGNSKLSVVADLEITGDIVLTGDVVSGTDAIAVTVSAPTAAQDGVSATMNASVAWASGNIVGGRFKTICTAATGTVYDMTGVWAGLQWTDAFNATGAGLSCALNAEFANADVSGQRTANSIVHIQSLPDTGATNANLPYICMTESGAGTGSNIMFELGCAAAGQTVTSGSGLLFDTTTLQIKVNGSARYIPLSTATNALTTAAVITTSGGIVVAPTAAGAKLDFQLETEWVSGTLIDADFGSATTLSNDAVGMDLDFNANVTMTTDKDLTGYQVKLPAFTQSDANTTRIYGFSLPTAGAVVQSSGAGTLDWRGVNIQMPNITQTAGTVTSIGIQITGGTVSSGTEYGLALGVDAAGVDAIFYGDTTGYKVWWDQNGDTNGAWFFGADTKGVQVNLYGDVTGCGVFWDPTTDTNGTLTIGGSGGSKGNDVIMYGATSGSFTQWDQSANQLLTTNVQQVGTSSTTGSGAWNHQYNLLTVASSHSGQSVCGMRVLVQTDDTTGRTVGNLYGLRAEAKTQHENDVVTGIMVGVYAAINPCDSTSAGYAYPIYAQVNATGTRANAPEAFVGMADAGSASGNAVMYLLDVGGSGSNCPAGSNLLFDTTTLRIRVNNADRFIPLSTATNAFTTAAAFTTTGKITSTCVSPKALFIGTDADTQGSGIELVGSDWGTSQGVGFYADDGGHVQTGYTETLTARYLLTANVTGEADVSCAAIHPDLAINASYDGKGGLNALWASSRLYTGKTLTTDSGWGNLGGGHFSVDLDAGSIVAANSWVAPVSIGFTDQGATRNGYVVGLLIRKSMGNVGIYDGAFGFINGDGVCQPAAGSVQDLNLRVLVMSQVDRSAQVYTIPMYRVT